MIGEAEVKTDSYDKEAFAKFDDEIDICLGEFDKKGKINSNIAVFNYDFTFFMSPEELKKFPKEKLPAKITAPKSFDLSLAERVVITKEELKRREMMEQEKLKNI